jgi:uncharacterized protein with PIN domain
MKQCLNRCPACDAGINDISWEEIQVQGKEAWQYATCEACHCRFAETYSYIGSEILG